MNSLVFQDHSYERLHQQLISANDPRENCAILLAHRAKSKDGWRFLVTRHHIAPPEAFQVRKRHAAVLHPDFVADVTKQAKSSGQSVVFVHTHPDSDHPQFSTIDDEGEKRLDDFARRRLGGEPQVALVIGKKGCAARVLGNRDEIRVCQVGTSVAIFGNEEHGHDLLDNYDRQIRAFGALGQERVQGMRIGIVGLGGTGSIVLDMLARIGVRKFVLVDPDVVEQSNLNRLVGSNAKSVGLPKVLVARDNATNILQGPTEINTIQGSILDSDPVQQLKSVDFLFGCTDSYSSRVVLNQLAYQYLIPCIDVGVGIGTENGKVTNITGRVQFLGPGYGCLICGGQMDYDAVRREFMNDAHRNADPYFVGEGVPQPSVVSINGTVSSLAVTMFLSVVAGIPSKPRLLSYDGIEGRQRSQIAAQEANCLVCSPHGALAKGDSWELPLRKL